MNTKSDTRVLIVDDAATVRRYHRQLIEPLGVCVDEAENGVEALEKALSNTYSLVLADVNMPKMDGLTLLSEMRQHPALASLPVIMISTETRDNEKNAAMARGASFYMVKPCQPDVLRQVVSLIIGTTV